MDPWLTVAVAAFAISLIHRVRGWMRRRGWIRERRRRGTSAAVGNALLSVNSFYQPSTREIMAARLEEPAEAAESGDPPKPGE